MKNIRKGCAVFLLLLSLCSCTVIETEKEEFPQLIIGGIIYSPYFYQNIDGKYVGIDVDIATEACQRMGYVPVFRELETEDKFELLEKGEVDCLWSCLSVEGNTEKAIWTKPYLYTQRVIVVPEDSEIQSIEDLKDKKVALQSGSSSENIIINGLNDNFPMVKRLMSYSSLEKAFMALRKNYVDAVIGHESSMMVYTEEYTDQYRYLHVSLRSEALGVAFSKENDGVIVDKLNQVIGEMVEDGTMESIIQKYGLDVKKNLYGGMYNEEVD